MFVDMSAAVVDELCCFLSCAVHLVLWARRVYPREAFERRRHLDVTVFRSRHVELNEYIALIVQGARQLIERGEADRLVIAVRSGRVVFERFRFDVRYDGRAVDLDALREQLRGFLLKLLTCDAQLGPLPYDAELDFTAELHTDATHAPLPLPEPYAAASRSNAPLLASASDAACAHVALCLRLLHDWAEASVPQELGSMPVGTEPVVVPFKSLDVDGLTIGLSCIAARMTSASGR
jgi:hypothetical protein